MCFAFSSVIKVRERKRKNIIERHLFAKFKQMQIIFLVNKKFNLFWRKLAAAASYDRARGNQCDQIGRFFELWATF